MLDMVRDVYSSYVSNINHYQAYIVTSKRVVVLGWNIDFTVAESEYLFQLASSEIDNHANTHVIGNNFCVLFTTSKKCTVSQFLS